MERLTLPPQDGTAIPVLRWPVTKASRAVVQIVHGMAEHAGRYDRLARELNAAGYAVYAHDQRGHGLARRDPAASGEAGAGAGWRTLVEDVAQVRRFLDRECPGMPVFLLGHSRGSFLAREFAAQSGAPLAGLILSATYEQPRLIARVGLLLAQVERLRLGAAGYSRLLRALTFDAFNSRFAPTRTSFDWLSRDQEAVARYVADPLCGFLPPVQLWVELLGALAAGLPLPPTAVPVLLLVGASDPVCASDPGAQRLEGRLRRAGSPVARHAYPGARHELFHETNQAEVFADLLAWLEQIVPGR